MQRVASLSTTYGRVLSCQGRGTGGKDYLPLAVCSAPGIRSGRRFATTLKKPCNNSHWMSSPHKNENSNAVNDSTNSISVTPLRLDAQTNLHSPSRWSMKRRAAPTTYGAPIHPIEGHDRCHNSRTQRRALFRRASRRPYELIKNLRTTQISMAMLFFPCDSLRQYAAVKR